MDDERSQQTDPRETVEGPGGSELAPEGNSKARIFVPRGTEAPRAEPSNEDSASSAGAEPRESGQDDAPRPEGSAGGKSGGDEQTSSAARFGVPARIAAVSGIALGAAGAAAALARGRRRRPSPAGGVGGPGFSRGCRS